MSTHIVCSFCQHEFMRSKGHINYGRKKYKLTFCSLACIGYYKSLHGIQEKKCAHCGLNVIRKISQLAKTKTGNCFCTHSCAAKYNNAHKKHGTRRSKLEIWLETQLVAQFPSLEFVFNGKEAINSELDIFIPALKLAFELNGIFHYEPIYGETKLSSIQSNDCRKFAACHERGISLCIIDTSRFTYFKVEKAMVFFNIIKDKIDLNLSGVENSNL